MKRLLVLSAKKAAVLAVLGTMFAGVNVFASDTSNVESVLNDSNWLYNKICELSEQDEGLEPEFFVKDMNNDGKAEIYVLAGMSQGSFHANSENYLISFVNGSPQITSYYGDVFDGYNAESGIFVNSYFGMGYTELQVNKFNKDGTITKLHDISVCNGNSPNTDEEKAHADSNGLIYFTEIDGGERVYYPDLDAVSSEIKSMMAEYNLTIPESYAMTQANYQAAIAEEKNSSSNNTVETPEGVSVYINGEKVNFEDAQPEIIDDRTYVPVRTVAEALGLEVDWDSSTQTATFTRDGEVVSQHTMGTNCVYIGGEAQYFDTPSLTVSSRTMMPVRMLSESVGATVEWDGSTKSVNIK